MTSSSTKCEICQSGYSITADGQCTIIRGTNPTTSIREDVSDDPRGGGNGIDLTDFQIAGLSSMQCFYLPHIVIYSHI